MANDGYMGKILKVDLTSGEITTIATEKYKEFGGGHGIGTAVFFDECEDITVDGLDPKNVVTIMTSPLSGTIAPAASGRTEIQGIGLQSYPKQWFTRSNFGGRFSGMLKYAGWDGIVIKGKAKNPCWLDIRDGKVKIQSAEGIWGLDTYETQKNIWQQVRSTSGREFGSGWYTLAKGRDTGNTTENSCVLAIGPLGETLSPLACLIHESGSGAGQGGFGAVFGSKNLKAVSVIGSGEVVPADMKALMDTRLWSQQYALLGNVDKPIPAGPPDMSFAAPPGGGTPYPIQPIQPTAPYGCMACHKCCRQRFKSGKAAGSSCVDLAFYLAGDMEVHGAPTQVTLDVAEMAQRAGIDDYPLMVMLSWLPALNKMGVLGPGKEIDTDLPFELFGMDDFVEILIDKIVNQKDIGKYLHMGLPQGAAALGRYDEDTTTGVLDLAYWGYPNHYDPRTEAEWGYGTILGDRDINEHDANYLCYWTISRAIIAGKQPPFTPQEIAECYAEKLSPYNDPMSVDYSDEGIYSDSMAHLVAWHRHYTRYYKQSMLFCEWAYSDIWNPYTPDHKGLTGEIEPRIINAVTGKHEDYLAGLEMGRKIWNFDRAIWCLEGRTVKDEVFANYIYEVPQGGGVPYFMPAYIDGKWQFKDMTGRKLDREKVEAWKQKYYALEGWDANGVPTRKTLESLGLTKAADALEKAGKLS